MSEKINGTVEQKLSKFLLDVLNSLEVNENTSKNVSNKDVFNKDVSSKDVSKEEFTEMNISETKNVPSKNWKVIINTMKHINDKMIKTYMNFLSLHDDLNINNYIVKKIYTDIEDALKNCIFEMQSLYAIAGIDKVASIKCINSISAKISTCENLVSNDKFKLELLSSNNYDWKNHFKQDFIYIRYDLIELNNMLL